MSDIVKQTTDVHFIVAIHALSNSDSTPLVAIATKNTDATTKSNIYDDLESLSADYAENTGVYAQAAAMFDVNGFRGPVEVIAYPNVDSTGVQSQGTDDGGTVTATTTPGIIVGITQHLFDGFKYLVLDGATEAETEALSDFLYDNQRIMLVTQPNSVTALQTLATHVAGVQTVKNQLGNTAAIVETATDRYPAAQAVAYAAANLPVDFQHIGNLSQFEPDADLTTDDYDTIAGLNATLVVNKAGDYMLLNGKALAGNYIDQFVHTQLVIDTLQTSLQKYLNRKNFPIYNDATIKEMTQTINAVSTSLLQMGVLYTPIVVNSVPRANVPNGDVVARKYNGFSLSAQIADDIDTINAKLDLTL
ncbi:hypothetical protein [Lentilactobacillus farraginis]|uniref:Uncharacterized protein n=1 Tax=Lentilactobacillus farraginis DSM 18382 = JCM 14108 TaxID=1423743 RepID=X0QFX8_9LACO|nr:hypothetical protein [Lentilactobacillus farraginis]KRM11259.1 hypothetical protein FD41_GL001542 [Lentilactobacillus farraginis DSM 18382 = JCM 14108]GAF37500.1 hypothetical protein JCM14108_2536 [Lentilactobacillus farraginis DSM 18382 = JCM 14108]